VLFLPSDKKYSIKNHLPIKYLPSVTLDKGFAECLGHSAKNDSPVVFAEGHVSPRA
jgi:hypothetical protein